MKIIYLCLIVLMISCSKDEMKPGDTTPPVIIMEGLDQTLEVHSIFIDLGASVSDNIDPSITLSVDDDINMSVVGEYTVTYTATDTAGNSAKAIRKVSVVDTTIPIITLIVGDEVLEFGDSHTAAAFLCEDNYDGDITSEVIIRGIVDSDLGVYILRYNATDSNGNSAIEVSRTVTIEDTTNPVLTISSDEVIEYGSVYTPTQLTATDNYDGDITLLIIETGTVGTDLGEYTLTYTITDSSGNTTQKSRSITIEDTTPPVITLAFGDETIAVGSTFEDTVVTVTDNYDTNLIDELVVSGAVNSSEVGSYELFYNVTDSSGNSAVTKSRTVTVEDLTPPVLTLSQGDIIVEYSESFESDIFSSIDNYDGDISTSVSVDIVTNEGERSSSNLYTYTSIDSSGNVSTATRTVYIIDADDFYSGWGPIYVDGLSLKLIGKPPESEIESSTEFPFMPDVFGRYDVRVFSENTEKFITKTSVSFVSRFSQEPFANAGEDLRHFDNLDMVTISSSGSYVPEGGSIFYMWSVELCPIGSVLSGGSWTGEDDLSLVLTPDLYGTYIIKLTIQDMATMKTNSDFVTLTFGPGTPISSTTVGDIHLGISDSPFYLEDNVGIMGLLTADPGVVIKGRGFNLYGLTGGSISLSGTSSRSIYLDNVKINAYDGHTPILNFDYTFWLNNSSFCLINNPFRDCHGGISITNSTIKDTPNGRASSRAGWSDIWYPTRIVEISNNIFTNSHAISIGMNGGIYANIENNVFHNMTGKLYYGHGAILGWNGVINVNKNTFIPGGTELLTNQLGYGGNVIPLGNYWVGEEFYNYYYYLLNINIEGFYSTDISADTPDGRKYVY